MAQRRNFTAEFKAQIVLAILTGQREPAEIYREYDLHPNVVSRWKAEFLECAASIFEKSNGSAERDQQIAELERMVGRLTMENEILKKALPLLNAAVKKSGRS